MQCTKNHEGGRQSCQAGEATRDASIIKTGMLVTAETDKKTSASIGRKRVLPTVCLLPVSHHVGTDHLGPKRVHSAVNVAGHANKGRF